MLANAPRKATALVQTNAGALKGVAFDHLLHRVRFGTRSRQKSDQRVLWKALDADAQQIVPHLRAVPDAPSALVQHFPHTAPHAINAARFVELQLEAGRLRTKSARIASPGYERCKALQPPFEAGEPFTLERQ